MKNCPDFGNLSGRCVVVVTRPAPDHVDLLQQLESKGWPFIHSPAFAIEPVSALVLSRILSELATCDLVLVTSPAAARQMTSMRAPVGSPGGSVFFCPGPGTAHELEKLGIPARYPERGSTSEDLLDLPELNQVAGRRIAILAAPGGRGVLLERLRDRGARVRRHFVYRRVRCARALALEAALRKHIPLAFLFSSGAALEALYQSLPAGLRQPMMASCFVVSSKRLAEKCRAMGAAVVKIAVGASNQAMLEALEEGGDGSGPSRCADFR